MYGRIQYCLKHGHDWSIWQVNEDGLLMTQCAICGAKQVKI